MLLSDLNVDCLLKVFRFLSVADMARTSEVCLLFQYVAGETFKYEWKNKTVLLSNNSKTSKLESTSILRNFGSQLQKVRLAFDQHDNDIFFNMIIAKCSSQLTEVGFASTCLNVQLGKVISKENIRRFNEKFGNIKRLRFENNIDDITEPECIERHFPALDELSLFGYPFENRNVKHFVKLNPQVRSLSTFYCNNFQDARNLLEMIDQQLPKLEELGLWMHGHADEIEYQPIFLKSLRLLKVHNYGKAANLQHLSISSERVQEMELELGACDEILIDFVCQYKQLNKLAIRMYSDSQFDCKFLKKLSKHLPKMAEIEIRGFWKNLNHTDIANYVHESKQLVKFVLGDSQRKDILKDMNNIQEKLDSTQWNVVYNSLPRQLHFVRVKRH